MTLERKESPETVLEIFFMAEQFNDIFFFAVDFNIYSVYIHWDPEFISETRSDEIPLSNYGYAAELRE